jgi:hypothetical protein
MLIVGNTFISDTQPASWIRKQTQPTHRPVTLALTLPYTQKTRAFKAQQALCFNRERSLLKK